jgi:biopolymer transport protein ExbB
MKHTVYILTIAALTLWVASPVPAEADEGLRSAYHKELSYLKAQRRALQERLEVLERREADEIGRAEGELDRLQGRLMSLQAESNRLQDTLSQVQREADEAERSTDAVATTIEQANATFAKSGEEVELPEADGVPDEAAGVERLFETADMLLRTHASVRTEAGSFFAADGTQQEGTLVLVGNIAAYGVSDEAAGALAPAGDGRLKLWEANAAQTARAMADGRRPEVLQAFLFESLDAPVEEQQEKTWLDIVNSGGVIAWVIVALGALGVLLVLLRALILWRAGANARGLVGSVAHKIVTGDIDAARKHCEQAGGSAARVLTRTLEHIDVDREQLDDVISESILHELPTLERFGSAILVFAAVAPLLGLLGTVTGMISTFDIITEFGTGDPKLLSGGISEALVTTQLGLIVAIPLLLVGNLLKGWAGSITTHIERGALRVMNLARLERGLEPVKGQQPDAEPVELGEATEYLGAI